MVAEIVSIGSELACGVSLDTNAQWLARQLSAAGIDVLYHTTVADDLQANIDVFRTAVHRAQLVIATGGLGPTLDDLTREAIAAVAGVELEQHTPSLERIQMIFQMFNRPMPERNRVQAFFPVEATVIPNENGTAPGIWMEIGGSLVVALPGVPREMKPMFIDWVLPRLRNRFGDGQVIVHRTIRCFGAGESQVEEMLGDLTKRGRHPEVGITASEATISLRITARAASEDAARALIEPDAQLIYQRLDDYIYGEEDDLLQTAVVQLLIERGLTVSTAESCTGGMLGEWLTELPGVSKCYLGGVVSYSNQAKMDLLDVPPSIIETKGAVSEECAAAMAQGCRTRFHSDLAVSITGIAGPEGGTPEKPVGLVYTALAHPGGIKIREFRWGNDRHSTRVRACKMALNMIRLYLKRSE